jgi:phosphoglycolate phosphatase-like HAD superfamily hydrolase
MNLLLFDIDGTLMKAGGAGFRAMDRAVEQRLGVHNATKGIIPHGKTDPLILREILRKIGVNRSTTSSLLPLLIEDYERLLAVEMPRAPAVLLPGVRELLDAFSTQRHVLLGLLTGNLERTARIKLNRFDLNRFFRFGAFGSDSEHRVALPAIAAGRAERLAGEPVALGRHIQVIGDTPRDVECALANGATAVAVATGGATAEELRSAGAHVVFEDFTHTADVVAAIMG